MIEQKRDVRPAIGAYPSAGAQAPPPRLLEGDNSFRQLGFRCALLFLFIRVGFVHEILMYETGVNTYILMLTGTLCTLLALISGGLPRIFSRRQAILWTAFGGWMAFTSLFSTWRTESLAITLGYFQNSWTLLLIVGGLAIGVKECMQVAGAIAMGGVVNALSGNLFKGGSDGRLFIGFGTIANSNDFAAHILFVTPFLILTMIWTRSKILKGTLLAIIFYILYLGAQTGSRGSLIAWGFVLLLILIRASGRVRVISLITIPAVLLILAVLLPNSIKQRYTTILDDEGTANTEAAASSEARKYLLKTSLQMTLENPLFGVGPAEFANTEGRESRARGEHGQWQASHNSYTQVSSEMGIPGFILYLAAIISTARLLGSIRKRCLPHPRLRLVGTAAFCCTLSLAGFSVAIIFLSQAYSFYLLLLAGFAIALDRAAAAETVADAPQGPATTPLSARSARFVRA